jgi:hypothetical protein
LELAGLTVHVINALAISGALDEPRNQRFLPGVLQLELFRVFSLRLYPPRSR